jgi:predicted RNA-binding Zn ribbon-like protein
VEKNGVFRSLGNRMCLDFANLPYFPGDPVRHPGSWPELVDFLAERRIVSAERAGELQQLSESDPAAAHNLMRLSERLGDGIRFAARALIRGSRVHREWVEPVNEVLRVTEGHEELRWDGTAWRMGFVGKHEGPEWLLAAVARSAAELVGAGEQSRVRQCANANCQILFCDDSRTHRRRWCSMALCGNRSKVAAFARRHSTGGEPLRAQHA